MSHMRIASQISTPAASAISRTPQRHRGRLRVAALMRAATSAFAEKGFDAATMTEIAGLAGASIGSLYQFFPSKEALADALLSRYGELVAAALDEVEARAAELSATALADALLDLLVGLRQETSAAVALLDARSEWSARRAELRQLIRRHIARILLGRSPRLSPDLVESMAAILLQNMRVMAMLIAEQAPDEPPGALVELRDMTRFYLANRLGRAGGATGAPRDADAAPIS